MAVSVEVKRLRSWKNDLMTKPKPPIDLLGEALEEWKRVTKELAALDRLNSADRSALTVYCRTFAVWNAAACQVAVHGAVIEHENHVRGQSHDYKVMRETAKVLKDLLVELGLTPKARGFDDATKALPPLKY